MGGFFGVTAKHKCIDDLFYGTDYNSHMGTKRAGMVTVKDGILPVPFTTSKALISALNSRMNYMSSPATQELESFPTLTHSLS